jgi:hypothetical protein
MKTFSGILNYSQAFIPVLKQGASSSCMHYVSSGTTHIQLYTSKAEFSIFNFQFSIMEIFILNVFEAFQQHLFITSEYLGDYWRLIFVCQ